MYLTLEELERKLYIENHPLHKVFVEKLNELEEIDSDQLQLKYEEGYEAGFEAGYAEGKEDGFNEGYDACLEDK